MKLMPSVRTTLVAAVLAMSVGCTPPDNNGTGGGAGGGVFGTGGGFGVTGGGSAVTGGGSAVTGGGSAVTGGGDGTTGGGDGTAGGGTAVTGGGDGTTGGGTAVTGGGDGTTGGGTATTGGGTATTGGGTATTGGGTATTGGGTATTGGGTATTGGGTATTGGGTGTTGGGTAACTELTIGPGQATSGAFAFAFTPELGDAGTPDALLLEFYTTDTGSFSLSMAPNDNYETCEQCVRLLEDNGDKQFFQTGGSMAIDATSDLANGIVSGSLTDVTLVEVTIDPTTFTSTPVAGGACLHITSATFDVSPPAGWTCDPSYYNDGTCDCGCAVQDADCASTTDISECLDNCATGTEANPADTTQCIPSGGTGGGTGTTGGGTGTTGGGTGTTGGGTGTAANDTCSTAETLVFVDNGNGTSTATASGDTTQATNGNVPNAEVSCSSTADLDGQDLVYLLHLDTPQHVKVTVTPTGTYQPVVYIRSGSANCANDASEIACVAFSSGPVVVEPSGLLPAGDHFIWVDTYVEQPGAFTMSVTLTDPAVACGNGTIDTALGETCDDGPPGDGDGCSSTCQIEPGYVCAGAPSVCVVACGNGTIDTSVGETCDDGPPGDGDGCSSTCHVEPGFVCAGAPSVCTMVEQACSDGLDNDNDGMVDANDSDCALPAYFAPCASGESLYVYSSGPIGQLVPGAPGLTYTATVSGITDIVHRAAVLTNFTHVYDGDLFFTIAAPAGNPITLASGVGSSNDNFTATLFDSTCTTGISSGTAPYTGCFVPQGSLTPLINTSPNGVWTFNAIDTYPSLDDGTLDSWKLAICTGASVVCGNSIIEAGETCDDGNANPTDGCSATCTTEQGYTCVGTGPGSCTASFTNIAPASCTDMTTATTLTLVASGTYAATDEGYTATAALPFSWSMYGTPVGFFSVSSNGFVGFFDTASGALTGNSYTHPTSIPASATPNGYLAPFWDDLDGMVVKTLTTGTAGAQVFTIEWSGYPYSSSADTMRFQVKVLEAGGAQFHYCAASGADTDVLNGNGALIGAEGTAGMVGSAISIDTAIINWGTSAWQWTL